jgi:hypothetical protein
MNTILVPLDSSPLMDVPKYLVGCNRAFSIISIMSSRPTSR